MKEQLEEAIEEIGGESAFGNWLGPSRNNSEKRKGFLVHRCRENQVHGPTPRDAKRKVLLPFPAVGNAALKASDG
jgi:hypothetical protein